MSSKSSSYNVEERSKYSSCSSCNRFLLYPILPTEISTLCPHLNLIIPGLLRLLRLQVLVVGIILASWCGRKSKVRRQHQLDRPELVVYLPQSCSFLAYMVDPPGLSSLPLDHRVQFRLLCKYNRSVTRLLMRRRVKAMGSSFLAFSSSLLLFAFRMLVNCSEWFPQFVILPLHSI